MTAVLQTPRPRIGYKKNQSKSDWLVQYRQIRLGKRGPKEKKNQTAPTVGESAKAKRPFFVVHTWQRDLRDLFLLYIFLSFGSLCVCVSTVMAYLFDLIFFALLCHTKSAVLLLFFIHTDCCCGLCLLLTTGWTDGRKGKRPFGDINGFFGVLIWNIIHIIVREGFGRLFLF
jgi:hypothetical protein